MTERESLLTYNDYARIAALPENRDRAFELIDGEIIEKVPSFIHSRLASFCPVYCFRSTRFLVNDLF